MCFRRPEVSAGHGEYFCDIIQLWYWLLISRNSSIYTSWRWRSLTTVDRATRS